MRKIPKVTVCLLSQHPLVLDEWERQLSPAGFKLQARRLEATLVPALDRLSLPAAEVFVIDAHAPAQTTEVLVAAIRNRYPHARQVVVAEKLSESQAFALLRLGAKALLSYAELRKRLAQALKVVADGGFWVPRELLSRFIESHLAPVRARLAPPGPLSLTQRERQVFDCILENLANKEIGDRLHISERTVKFHVSSLLEKFGVRRRSDLILQCFQDRPPVP